MEGLETIEFTPPSCYALVNCTTGQVDYILNGTANGVDLASYLNQFVGRIELPTGTVYGCWSIQTSFGCEGFRSDIGVYDIVASGDETNYCGCPDDYVRIGNDCLKYRGEDPIFNGNFPSSANTPDTDHGLYGTVFFPIGNITTTPLPIGDITAGSYGTPPISGVFKNGGNIMLPAPTNITRPLVGPYPFWGPLVGRLDDVGVWANTTNVCGEWIGFSICFPALSLPSTFCIGLAGIDQVRCKINGKPIVIIDQTDYTYKTWNVFELNIDNSLEYVIEFEAKQINCGPVATPALGAEVYNIDLATLQSITNQVTLDSSTVFTTKNYRTSGYFDIGETIGYTCPPGYYFDKCSPIPLCSYRNILPTLDCCYQLLRCSDSTVEAQFRFNGNQTWPGVPFPTSIGNQAITSITLSDGTVMQGCWYLFKTPTGECNPLVPGPVYDWSDTFIGDPYIQAITLVTDCTVCNPTIYVLKDCKTGFPYELEGAILYLSLIAGACSSGTCPNDIGDDIITSIVNQSIPEITGCYSLVSVNVQLDTISTVPYQQIMQTVTTVATCEICYPTCYKLTNCVDPTIVIYTQNDLSNYIGYTITLAGYSSICWIVEVTDTCPDPVSIPNITSSTPYSGTAPLTKCCYTFPKAGIMGTAIEIDGVIYTNPNPANDIVSFINSLGVGICTIERLDFPARICITNNTSTSHTYGSITYAPGGVYQFIPSSCEVIIKSCVYEPYDFSTGPALPWNDATVSIIIDGVTYTSSVFDIEDISYIITYLNSLNQGTFAFTCDIIGTCTIYASGNYTFGPITITLEDSTEIVIALEDCEGPTIECQECIDNLPGPPVPPTPVFELHPRSVKPGYNTPACDPAYTEKVLCNYAEQAFDEMAKARYGIKICCEHDFDYWDLKKQILELKAQYDESLCQVQFPCKCYSISNLNPTTPTEFKYSDCNGKYLTTTITNADGIVKVCATNLPIGTGGTPIVELNGLCPNEICP